MPNYITEISPDNNSHVYQIKDKEATSIDLLKDTVGWIGNNLADMSKVEIGINVSGTANTKKARLIMPCESSKTYYVSANGTNRFTSVQFLTTATIPPDFPILEGGSLPYSIDTRSTDKYIIFQFNKETDVTQDDINVLKFMVSETNGDVYEPYHDNVDLTIDKKAELLVKDTVGWVGKNALPYPFKQGSASNRGITFTDNGDGTLTLNGTQNDVSSNAVYQMHGAWNTTTLILPAGQYRITTGTNNNDVIIGVSYSNQFLGATNNGVLEVNAPNGISYITCEVKKGAPQLTDVLVKPMVRDASIADSTYEPYHKSVEDWYWENNPNAGVKNLYNFEASDVKENLGATYTVSGGEVTINCTTTDYSGAFLKNASLRSKFASLANVPCILNFEYKSSVACNGLVGFSGVEEMPTTWTKKELSVSNPAQISDVVFYNRDTTKSPVISARNFMLQLAADTDNTYQPYAMTNRELTEKAAFILGYPSAARAIANNTSVSVKLSKKVYPTYSSANSTYLVIAYKYGYGLPTGYLIGFMASQNASSKYKEIKSDNAADLTLDIATANDIDTITLTCASAAYMNLAVYKLPLNYDGYDYLP